MQKYETGEIKKIPLEVIKKISEFYGTDYYMYFWWTKFNSLSDIILHFIYFPENFSKDRKLFEILGITEYFDSDTKAGTYISLYNKLTEEEKENFYRFKNVVLNTLKSDKYFTDDELEKEDKAGTYISLYNKLTEEEKENFYRFKNVVLNTLKSDKYFTDDELEKEDVYLFCYFFAHKIKREKQINLEILKEDKLKKV